MKLKNSTLFLDKIGPILVRKCVIFVGYLVFISTSGLVQAQVGVFRQNQRDSLFAIYTTCEDIEKAKSSYALSMYYKDVNMDTSMIYAQKAKELSLKFKAYQLYAKSLKRIGVIHLYADDLIQAENYFNRALHIASGDKDSLLVAAIQSDQGLLYDRKSSYEESLSNLMDSYFYFKDKPASIDKHIAFNRLGILYAKVNKKERSLKTFEEALQVAMALKETDRIITSYINIAFLKTQLEAFEESTELYKKILNMPVEQNLTFLNQTKTCYNNLAYNYYKIKKFDSSLYYAKKCLRIPADNLFDSRVAQTYRIMGNVYLARKDYKKAESYLNKSLQISKEYGIKEFLIDIYKDLYQYHKEVNNYQLALSYFEKFKTLESNVLDKDFSEEISRIESSKVIEQKDVAYASLSKAKADDKKEFESNIERIVWIVSVSLIGILGLIVLYFYRNRAALAEQQKQLSMMKLFALRSQMNPHFIFNTINGVQNFILKADKFQAYNYLSKFSNSIRLILDNSSNSFIRLHKELELIKVYVDLEKIRFRDKITFQMDIDTEIEEQNPYIPAMILQPLIENSIIHGISNKSKGGRVHLKIEGFQENLKVIIEDDGIGRKEAQRIKDTKPRNVSGITSINTKQRIEVLKKSGYKDAYYAFTDIKNGNGTITGTRIVLILPLKNQYDKDRESHNR